MKPETIGKYRVIRLIGEGGMASVYEAQHELLHFKAAIKVLKPELSSNIEMRERFMKEARFLASLDHPNITKIIDFDEQTNRLCIIMEFLSGEDLSQRVRRDGPLQEAQIVEIFTQVFSALKYAHEKGIVHRDIKPSNIFILSNNKVKILDFGIAKVFGHGNELTMTGQLMGTPVYMSPEQVRADKYIDHRTDIYSLGVTIYYAVSGVPPYDGHTDSQFNIFNKIVYEAIPEIPSKDGISSIVQTACRKEREDRYQNCDEMLSALHRLDSDRSHLRDHVGMSESSVGGMPYEGTQTIHDREKSALNSEEGSIVVEKKKNPYRWYVPILCFVSSYLFWRFILGNEYGFRYPDLNGGVWPRHVAPRSDLAMIYDYGPIIPLVSGLLLSVLTYFILRLRKPRL